MATMDDVSRSAAAVRITAVGSVVNFALAALKLAAGIYGASGAMVADAMHSLSDLATDVAVLLGFRYVVRPADKTHDYGHGKAETIVSVFVGAALAAAAALVIYGSARGVMRILSDGSARAPSAAALAAGIVSVIVKEIMYRRTVDVGKKINSMAVVANAWHHRSDSLSSVAAVLGIAGAMVLGGKWVILDPLAAAVVGALILKVAYDIAMRGVRELMDESLCDEEEKKVVEAAASVYGVANPHGVRSRRIGSSVAVEIHIEVSGEMSVSKSHELATDVEEKISKMFDGRTFVSVHVEPRASGS